MPKQTILRIVKQFVFVCDKSGNLCGAGFIIDINQEVRVCEDYYKIYGFSTVESKLIL